MTLSRVVLQPRKARPFFGRHPWVFAGAISGVEGDPADGAEVDLHSHEGQFIARGLFNKRSNIRVRLYSWDADTPLDAAFFRGQLEAALRLRGPILGLDGPGRAARLVFSEGDGISGLTVDRYDQFLMVQFTSLALAQRRDLFLDLLMELVQPRGIYLRTERGIGTLEGLDLADGPLRGEVPGEPIVIEEDGLRFLVNLCEGQKTGFFLDQRDNRRLVAGFAKGRRVLDAFCYTGGFSLHAARAGAASVVGVDISEPALTLAKANAELNGLGNITFIKSDVFRQMDEYLASGERFGLVVLDPPKFARARNALDEALRGYRRLQSKAIKLLEPDGILVMCCCSGLIQMSMLEELLAELSVEERRAIQILQRGGQAADHPVAATCPESNYLKCLIARVC